MIRRAVAFVPREAVFRVTLVQVDQQAVAFDLRDDGSQRDRQALAVAAFDRFVRPSERPQRQPVDEHEDIAFLRAAKEFALRAGSREERRQRPLGQLRDTAGHRQPRRPEDVVGRDLQHRGLRPDRAQFPLAVHFRDPRAEFRPFLGRELLRVVGSGEFPDPGRFPVEPGVEEHRPRHDRPAQRPAAGFIDARDAWTSGAALTVEGCQRSHRITPPSCGG